MDQTLLALYKARLLDMYLEDKSITTAGRLADKQLVRLHDAMLTRSSQIAAHRFAYKLELRVQSERKIHHG